MESEGTGPLEGVSEGVIWREAIRFGNCLCAGSGLSAADTHLALPPAAVGRTAVERRAARRDASPHRTAVERRSYQANFAKCGGGGRVVEAPPRWRLSQLVRRRDGGFPCGGRGATALPGGSAGYLAPSGDGQKGDK